MRPTPPRRSASGLQAFCIPGSVADDRKVGIGHGNLAATSAARGDAVLLPSWPATNRSPRPRAPSSIAEMANKVRKNPLRVILNGLGKDAATIISRINGFTYVQTEYRLLYRRAERCVKETPYSDGGRRGKVTLLRRGRRARGRGRLCRHEGVDVSITGNSTNPTRFQHPVAGTYKK